MKNQSEYFVHATKDGVTESFGPGEDIPSWVAIDNPYVKGKAEDKPEEDPPAEDAPRRGRPRKAADDS